MCRGSSASTLSIASRHGPKPPDRALREIHVNAVVDRVAGDDQLEIRNVEDAGVVAVGVADLDDHEVVSFEREAVVWHRHCRDRRLGGIPRYTLSQSKGRAVTLACICAIVPAVATTRAPNRSASSPAANQ